MCQCWKNVWIYVCVFLNSITSPLPPGRSANIKDSKEILKLIKELAEFENELEKVELNLTDIKNHGFGKAPIFKCFVAEYLNIAFQIALSVFLKQRGIEQCGIY